MPILKKPKKKIAICLPTTNCYRSQSNDLKKTTIFLSTLLFLFSPTFSQQDSILPTQLILPLQVSSIEAKVINQNVQLLWTVTSNEEAKSFEVERAGDNALFKKIGGKLPAANSTTASYEFVDALPGTNTAFSYRIKIVAKDGTHFYSALQGVKVNDEIIRCKLRQNPVGATVEAEIILSQAITAQVSIYTGYGQKVLTTTSRFVAGINQISLSSQNLLPGVHRLVVETGSERKVISFVKE